jgi:hypothetical protein
MKKSRTTQVEELRMAYRVVYGVEGERTIAQQMVWDDEKDRACYDRTTQVLTRDGRIDPIISATNEGRRQQFLETKAKVESKPIDTND